MIEEIWFWVSYMAVILVPYVARYFIKDEPEPIAYPKLFPDEAKVCEYCGIKGEIGDQYCHLCGTGLMVKNDEM